MGARDQTLGSQCARQMPCLPYLARGITHWGIQRSLTYIKQLLKIDMIGS